MSAFAQSAAGSVAAAAHATPPLLDVRNVGVRFGGLQALDQVSFDVRRGEILALIGPNGAGKSTMLNVISGFQKPDCGEVWFKGQCLAGLTPDRVNRQGLARTFQAAEVLRGMTVVENIMAAGVAQSGCGLLAGLLGAGPAARVTRRLRQQALTRLEVVGLAELADAPAGLLTAGQQRLLAAARALATGAELLILDEPGAGLNSAEKQTLGDAILRIREHGTTIVFVEHDLTFVGRLAERMVVLDHGRMLAKGEPDSVRADPAVIAAYLGNTRIEAAPAHQRAQAQAKPLLAVQGLNVRYGGLTALKDVTLEVRQGEIVSLIGANGAGKSTLLKAISGMVAPASGSVRFDGGELAGMPVEKRTAIGIALAPEGRALFPTLTVRDNLMMGRYAQVRGAGVLNLLKPGRRGTREMQDALQEVLAFFPRLAERIDQLAGTLSGGEGQMVAIGRALMSRPRLLMLDEPSFGLAPQVTREILESLPRLADTGLTVLLVEQNAHAALQVSDRGYVLANGVLVRQGSGSGLLAQADIGEAYLGLGGIKEAA